MRGVLYMFTKIRKRNLILNFIDEYFLYACKDRYGKYIWNLISNYKLILNQKANQKYILITKNDQSKLSFSYNKYFFQFFENQLSIKELKDLLK